MMHRITTGSLTHRTIASAVTIAAVTLLLFAAPAPAAEGDPMVSPDQIGRPHLEYPHPEVPASDIVWAGVTVIVIVGLFLAAASVGPFVHALRDEDLPPGATHSHDEPPGASGHHGPGGTADTGHAHDH